jgi:cytochrome c-type biogenesis protein CcmH/NrfF
MITNIMEYSPVKRLTLFEAMCHPYFKDLKNESKFKEISAKVRCPKIYDYIRDELLSNKKLADRLLPL